MKILRVTYTKARTQKRSANAKSIQFGVQSSDYANNGGYNDSEYSNEEFMEKGDPPVDRNEISNQ